MQGRKGCHTGRHAGQKGGVCVCFRSDRVNAGVRSVFGVHLDLGRLAVAAAGWRSGGVARTEV
jgi:hypothetical protein